MTDLVIVGAGPAGLAAAIHARLAYMTCIVIEKGTRPLDKACGEGLMPAGVGALRSLGIDPTDLPHRTFQGVRYISGDTRAEGHFLGRGMGVRRTELIDSLALRAQELGAELWFGVPVEGWTEKDDCVVVRTPVAEVTGRYLVGADGLHSRTRRKAGLDHRHARSTRYGIRRHYRVTPWSNLVEVYWADDVEAYVTPIREDEVGIAMLYRGDGRGFDDLIETFTDLRERVGGASRVGRDRGAGPLRQRARKVTSGRIALIGDAAGYVDAITGEGVTLAFETARALVDTLSSGRPIRTYRRRYGDTTRTYRWLTQALIRIASCRSTRGRIVHSLARSPSTFDRFVQVAAGERNWREIGFVPALRLVAGMVA